MRQLLDRLAQAPPIRDTRRGGALERCGAPLDRGPACHFEVSEPAVDERLAESIEGEDE